MAGFYTRIRRGNPKGAKVGEFGPFKSKALAIKQGQVLADDPQLSRGCVITVEPATTVKRKKAPAKKAAPKKNTHPRKTTRRKRNPHPYGGKTTKTALRAKAKTLGKERADAKAKYRGKDWGSSNKKYGLDMEGYGLDAAAAKAHGAAFKKEIHALWMKAPAKKKAITKRKNPTHYAAAMAKIRDAEAKAATGKKTAARTALKAAANHAAQLSSSKASRVYAQIDAVEALLKKPARKKNPATKNDKPPKTLTVKQANGVNKRYSWVSNHRSAETAKKKAEGLRKQGYNARCKKFGVVFAIFKCGRPKAEKTATKAKKTNPKSRPVKGDVVHGKLHDGSSVKLLVTSVEDFGTDYKVAGRLWTKLTKKVAGTGRTVKRMGWQRGARTWVWGRTITKVERKNPKANPAKKRPATSRTFKGHTIKGTAKTGYTIEPYGIKKPTLKDAKLWVTRHVAGIKRTNPLATRRGTTLSLEDENTDEFTRAFRRR